MTDTSNLAKLYARYEEQNSRTPLRARDAAAALGISEAELVDAKRIPGFARVLRKEGDRGFAPILEAMKDVGEVMILTRNEHCVHERHGEFDKMNIGKIMGIVLNREIDLRLFMNHWAFGFALEEEVKSGKRLSLQFFDASGEAVHKIYAVDKTNRPALDSVIDAWIDDNPQDVVTKDPTPETADRPDEDIDVPALREAWEAMTDTHQMFGMLNKHKVGRLQALRLIGSDWAYPLESDAIGRLLDSAASAGTSIMCFVGNRGCIQIHTGPVKNIKTMGPWINVLDPRFNLHFRTDHVDSAWVVRRPTDDGIVTSVEFYGADGKSFCMFFGERMPGDKELAGWRLLVDRLDMRGAA